MSIYLRFQRSFQEGTWDLRIPTSDLHLRPLGGTPARYFRSVLSKHPLWFSRYFLQFKENGSMEVSWFWLGGNSSGWAVIQFYLSIILSSSQPAPNNLSIIINPANIVPLSQPIYIYIYICITLQYISHAFFNSKNTYI